MKKRVEDIPAAVDTRILLAGNDRPSMALKSVTDYMDWYLEMPVEFYNPLTEQRETRKAVEVIALMLLVEALHGDKHAQKAVMERTEGKVAGRASAAAPAPKASSLADTLRQNDAEAKAEAKRGGLIAYDPTKELMQ